MNYTIKYPCMGLVSQTPVTTPHPASCQTNQRTIVLSQPTQPQFSANTNSTPCNQQSNYPFVMQVGSGNNPVFYTYPNSETIVNPPLHNTSPVHSAMNLQGNNNSPNMATATVNIHHENKPASARGLGEMFNVQSVNTIPNSGRIVQAQGNVPVIAGNNPQQHVPVIAGNNPQQHVPVIAGNNPQQQTTTDFASIINSLQAAGLQVVENPSLNTSTSSIIMNNGVNTCEVNNENAAMANFISSLQGSGVQVVENNCDKTLSISLPTQHVEENRFLPEKSILPVASNGGAFEKMYKIIDGGGNVTVVTAGVNEAAPNDVPDQSVVMSSVGIVNKSNSPEMARYAYVKYHVQLAFALTLRLSLECITLTNDMYLYTFLYSQKNCTH